VRYVIATDGSDWSLRAARFFLRWSRPDAEDELFITFVFPLPPDPKCYEGVMSLPTHADDERVVQVGRPILATTREVFAESLCRMNEVILVGNPAKEIVEFAMNLRVDLIVAGTRGRSPEKEGYLGSVSGGISHRAPCSVLVVR
jgi:nucleotide-binding universal stress UspA family protein